MNITWEQKKTLYFFNGQNPTIPVSMSLVREVLRGFEKCARIDANPVITEKGSLGVEDNSDHLVCDVTHYFTVIDCGRSRFAIWKQIKTF